MCLSFDDEYRDLRAESSAFFVRGKSSFIRPHQDRIGIICHSN
jgi:hypothetical protein